MPGKEGRRQRRIERRKQEILDAAARIFAEKGYANTTTREIADAADIAEGTLYNYFGGKRKILLAIAEEMQPTMQDILQDVDKIQGRRDMIALIEEAYDNLASRSVFIRTFLSEAWIDDVIFQDFARGHVQRMVQQIEAFVAKRIDAGIFHPLDPALAASMVMGMLTAPIFPALRGLAEFPAPEKRRAIAETAVSLLLNGIQAREHNALEQS